MSVGPVAPRAGPEPSEPISARLRPKGCTALQLRQLTRAVSQLYDAELGKSGLKTTQYSLLSCVANLGPSRPGEIARALHMDASTLTRNLKPLVQSGLLALGPGPDGRSRQVEITATGRALREQARRHWRVAQHRLQALLGVEDVLALHLLIESSLTALDRNVHGENEHE